MLKCASEKKLLRKNSRFCARNKQISLPFNQRATQQFANRYGGKKSEINERLTGWVPL